MLDDMALSRAAALLLKPLLKSETANVAPVRFGGKPRLPDDLEWPVGHHFLAEIDFAQLPDHAEHCGQPIAFPDRPKHGSAFIFVKLWGDAIYDPGCVTVLYSDQDLSDVPFREPPDDLPNLHQDGDDWHLRRDAIESDGQVLIEQLATALPIISKDAVNPLWSNMIEAGSPPS